MRPAPVAGLERLAQICRTPAGKKMIRYVLQSAITTAVSFIVLGIVYGVFKLWSEVPSTVFANVVATVPSYFLNRNWVWGKSGRSHLVREVAPFWAASITGIVLSIFAATAARHVGQTYFLHDHGIRTGLVEGANLLAFGLLWIFKFLVFNHLFRDLPVAEVVSEHEPMDVRPGDRPVENPPVARHLAEDSTRPVGPSAHVP
ncbi:MAG TPA: GtrA family protein [Acidimicrobiales bacterium]|nr:GtrA family protein [Acidimicrobiales bacterium]